MPDSGFTRTYERVLGPAWYSFDWGDRDGRSVWHIVVYAEEDGFFTPAERERKARWLSADLGAQPAGRPVLLAMHRPPGAALLGWLRQRGVQLVLHGHNHYSQVRARRVQGGTVVVAEAPPLAIGAIDTRPRGYRVVQLWGADGASVRTELVAVPPMPVAPRSAGGARDAHRGGHGHSHGQSAPATEQARTYSIWEAGAWPGDAGWCACPGASIGPPSCPLATALDRRVRASRIPDATG